MLAITPSMQLIYFSYNMNILVIRNTRKKIINKFVTFIRLTAIMKVINASITGWPIGGAVILVSDNVCQVL